MTTDEQIGEALRWARRAIDLSQDDVTEIMWRHGCNWSKTTLSKIETGGRQLLFFEALILNHHVGISLTTLNVPGLTLNRESIVKTTYVEERAAARMGISVDELNKRSVARWGLDFRRRRLLLIDSMGRRGRGASGHIVRRMMRDLEQPGQPA